MSTCCQLARAKQNRPKHTGNGGFSGSGKASPWERRGGLGVGCSGGKREDG